MYFLLTNSGCTRCVCYIPRELGWLWFIFQLATTVLLHRSFVLPAGQWASWTYSSHGNGENGKESMPTYANIFQTFVCSMIPLAKASYMAYLKTWDRLSIALPFVRRTEKLHCRTHPMRVRKWRNWGWFNLQQYLRLKRRQVPISSQSLLS